MSLALWPNVGGEEPGGPDVPAARALAGLWRLLFPQDAGWPREEAAPWPAELGALPGDAAFDWLPGEGICAWWNDEAAAAEAAKRGLALAGPDPAAVARVHDKAFAARVARDERLGPRALREHVHAYDPDLLADPEGFRAQLARDLSDWPDTWRPLATLKPRLGTSGRGRVALPDLDDATWQGALPRLAARGGAMLEPWLPRVSDHSVQLHIGRDGTLTLLGTLTQRSSASGNLRGHTGELDHRGRVVCGDDLDDALLGPALDVARAAHSEGYSGPCGVDAFRYRDGDDIALRPVVEFNARCTAGTVVLGLLHRARPWLDAHLPPEPGRRRHFAFDYAPSPTQDPEGAGFVLHFAEASLRCE